jgi:hypothetical protein
VDQGTGPKPFLPDTANLLEHVRDVIDATDVPSWIPSVPREWGSASMGVPSADEWRTMATIYFPISLLSKWAGLEEASAEGKGRRQLLDLTMCIVIATLLACKRSIDESRRSTYLKYMSTYLHNFGSVVPHGKLKPNNHFSLHIYDFLNLWGPVHSWWCFPFERINGILQRIKISNVFGMSIFKLHSCHCLTTRNLIRRT